MNIEQIIELEIKTRETLSALEAEILAAEASAGPPGKLDGTEGRLSRQDSMLQHEMAKDGQRRRRLRLNLLREALAKMDTGEYGICVNCRAEIEYSRLELQPETPICGSCAQRN